MVSFLKVIIERSFVPPLLFRVIIVFRSKSLASALFRLLLCPTQVGSWLKERRIHTWCVLVGSSALSFGVSFVKIIIERSFLPQVPFEKFSTVDRGEHPVRNEVYAVAVRFLVRCRAIRFVAFLL